VTREELQKRLWPDTFVDVDHNLNTAINKIREVLGDSAENPRFVETLSRRGYRFIAPVEGISAAAIPTDVSGSNTPVPHRRRLLRLSILFVLVVLLATEGVFFLKRTKVRTSPMQRALTRLTFDEGLQIGATWSPDGRFIAYSSNRGGKFDIWVQQVSGGDPVRITKGPGHNWQPDWSPDGKFIAYRSEEGGGGLFVVPALGGEGLQRRIASFGYDPQWPPDSSQILFRTNQFLAFNRFDVVSLDGSQPREVLTEFLDKHPFLSAKSAAWHPDGKRISVWVWGSGPVPTFWTVPVAGGKEVRSEIDSQVLRQLGEVSVSPNDEMLRDCDFSWMPSGRAIYFERTFRGVRNLWKMTVDPETLRALAIERLTTGSGLDTELALSPDGKRLAFTMESERLQAWFFPFDGTRGRVTGNGQSMTSPAMEAWHTSLSQDGKKLAFVALRAGKWELWEKSLVDGREAPVATDDYYRNFPQWSPDGTRLAYGRRKFMMQGEVQLFVWSAESRNEEPLTAPSARRMAAHDWSPDGKQLLGERESRDTHRWEIWLLPLVAAGPHAGQEARTIISGPDYDLYQPRFSPDGRWIVFEAVRGEPARAESTLYVTPTTGGLWIHVTDGKYWDDKPRWAPDGKTIYYLSGRSGFFNVWGIHFDPAKGKVVGEPFRVTALESPGLMVPGFIPAVELSLTEDKLVLTLEERSGGIWVLDNVDR
jgi:Tol biopolymer transport system component